MADNGLESTVPKAGWLNVLLHLNGFTELLTFLFQYSIFDDNSANRLQLLGRALQNIKVFPEYKTSYITLSQKELDEFHYQKGDTEGIVNYGLSIKGIHFSAIFIEHRDENIIKILFDDKKNSI